MGLLDWFSDRDSKKKPDQPDAEAATEAGDESTKFSGKGNVPPVAAEPTGAGEASASEQGFDKKSKKKEGWSDDTKDAMRAGGMYVEPEEEGDPIPIANFNAETGMTSYTYI